MSFEVRGRWETPSYSFVYVRVSLLSACCASADLSSQGGIAIAIICLCQTIVFENKFSDIVSQIQTISDFTAFYLVCSRLLPPLVEGLWKKFSAFRFPLSVSPAPAVVSRRNRYLSFIY